MTIIGTTLRPPNLIRIFIGVLLLICVTRSSLIAQTDDAATQSTAWAAAAIAHAQPGLYTAQIYDNRAHLLIAPPSTLSVPVPVPGTDPVQRIETQVAQTGGTVALEHLAPVFFEGINDPVGLNPCGTAFRSDIFDIYDAWQSRATRIGDMENLPRQWPDWRCLQPSSRCT
jgi:hypothetical protein